MKPYPPTWIPRVLAALKQRYRTPAASLKKNPFGVLLFTALSARTRDQQTEIAFQKLIKIYPTATALAKATPKQVEPYLKTIGMYRTKAKNMVGMAQALVKQHKGRVPADLDLLTELPGVGRKTANCTLIYAFNKPAMCVDTHVHRISNRLGLVNTKTPDKTEMALRKLVPQRFWIHLNRVMVHFGRDICVPGRPKCWECPVREWCQYKQKTPKP
jgi:endonuclease III